MPVCVGGKTRARGRGLLEDLLAALCHGDYHRATLLCFRNTG